MIALALERIAELREAVPRAQRALEPEPVGEAILVRATPAEARLRERVETEPAAAGPAEEEVGHLGRLQHPRP
jgi:hypothetical protein